MNKRRILLWLGAAAVGAAALAQLAPGETPLAEATARAPSSAGTAPSVASERFAALPAREPIGKPKGELFAPRSWKPAAPPPPTRPSAAAVVEKPSAPPVPYRVAGQVVQEDGMRVVLAKGDRVFEARQGDTLEGGFRLEAIAPHSLTFVYLPLGVKQELQIAGVGLDVSPARNLAAAHVAPSTPAPPAATLQPAQLRFDGPSQVQAGKPFDVALKLTSRQPVRALPMQLSFDAKRLEPLAVRPGGLFPGGSFTYRVNPAGSIFVGASGAERAAADADFLIVTFRPIASGPAELKVSSLLVQGAAGRAIAHEPPQAFRAAVVQ